MKVEAELCVGGRGTRVRGGRGETVVQGLIGVGGGNGGGRMDEARG